ncbi:relaxase/mobilization nuclease domain-containing protein [Alterisphingorhabdus coralli]|uniref:Relaxase/mobilization nuclease domain-containing protein n=1 Tax=Alterisphingorhabdus coralli TaxID=3071408 RepID=A0AA97FA25_9SPHN|nr:relaxase/mobilization nuclease domain-containing protein [Parasphingorhabdus sp. SCSIO 66989]WOE76753.1 relaxase/mobilization nuclease domain-containing protein [Parasphingorhabdus sp. SCSIO 66989]
MVAVLSPGVANSVDRLHGRAYRGRKGSAHQTPNISLGGALGGGHFKTQKQAIDTMVRTATRTQEVMVKVTGRQKMGAGSFGNLAYISRLDDKNAENIALEDERGNIITTADQMRDISKQWARWNDAAVKGFDDRRKGDVSRSMMLSHGKEMDADVLMESAREWAKKELAGHRYVMALHTDTDHPHVHITYAARNKAGERTYPDRETLQRWRDSFAEQLRERGVEANATPRQTRWPEFKKVSLERIKRADRFDERLETVGITQYEIKELRNTISVYRDAANELKRAEDDQYRQAGKVIGAYANDLDFRLKEHLKEQPDKDSVSQNLTRATELPINREARDAFAETLDQLDKLKDYEPPSVADKSENDAPQGRDSAGDEREDSRAAPSHSDAPQGQDKEVDDALADLQAMADKLSSDKSVQDDKPERSDAPQGRASAGDDREDSRTAPSHSDAPQGQDKEVDDALADLQAMADKLSSDKSVQDDKPERSDAPQGRASAGDDREDSRTAPSHSDAPQGQDKEVDDALADLQAIADKLKTERADKLNEPAPPAEPDNQDEALQRILDKTRERDRDKSRG